MTAQAPKQRREINSRHPESAVVRKQVMAEVKEAGHHDDTVFAVHLALEEALANAIRHGNDADESKHVVIEWQITPKRISITVEDEGHGFNPDDVPDPTLEENLTRPSGRGVMLMRAYMTDVSFNDAGNRVTLVKDVSAED